MTNRQVEDKKHELRQAIFDYYNPKRSIKNKLSYTKSVTKEFTPVTPVYDREFIMQVLRTNLKTRLWDKEIHSWSSKNWEEFEKIKALSGLKNQTDKEHEIKKSNR